MNTFIEMLPVTTVLALAILVFSFCVAVIESPYKRGMTIATTVMWVSALVFVLSLAVFPYASNLKYQKQIERVEKLTKDQSRVQQ